MNKAWKWMPHKLKLVDERKKLSIHSGFLRHCLSWRRDRKWHRMSFTDACECLCVCKGARNSILDTLKNNDRESFNQCKLILSLLFFFTNIFIYCDERKRNLSFFFQTDIDWPGRKSSSRKDWSNLNSECTEAFPCVLCPPRRESSIFIPLFQLIDKGPNLDAGDNKIFFRC